jgi:hypothetical protein
MFEAYNDVYADEDEMADAAVIESAKVPAKVLRRPLILIGWISTMDGNVLTRRRLPSLCRNVQCS